MKKFQSILIVFFMSYMGLSAQDITSVEAVNQDISDNLDLEAIASIFGECEDLEEFEQKINFPETQISNLDLNNDGYVDYLRVVENSNEDAHLISIQAVIGQDLYQDVATVEISKDDTGETRVQVVGDVYMYGNDYIIEPFYYTTPVIFVYLWRPHRHMWYSPYYWDYYPSYFSPWRPFTTVVYLGHIRTHISPYHSYNYTVVRRSNDCVLLAKKARQNGMERTHPKTSFVDRNDGIKNRAELVKKRQNVSNSKSTGKKVDEKWENKNPQTKKIEVQKDTKKKAPDARKEPVQNTNKKERNTKTDRPKNDVQRNQEINKTSKSNSKVKTQKATTPEKSKATEQSKKTDTKSKPD